MLQAKIIKKSTPKVYPGYSHGMLTDNADVINPDLLTFIKG
jgi:non-heme chloroperoxidase